MAWYNFWKEEKLNPAQEEIVYSLEGGGPIASREIITNYRAGFLAIGLIKQLHFMSLTYYTSLKSSESACGFSCFKLVTGFNFV